MKKKNFLKKADTTEFDKYTCGNCSKFGTRWCPFVGTEHEPVAETRACEHFDKSYTVEVQNTDYNEVSSITQAENLYKHYEAPETIKVEEDDNEPFSHACGQCRKFGTVMCPYLETNSKARACQSFTIKSPDGEADIQIQNIDYDELTYDIPRENYHIHPETNTRKDMVEHPFAFKTIYPQPFRVANEETSKKTAQATPYQYGITEEQENALNTYLLDYRALKDSNLIKISLANISQEQFETKGFVTVEGVIPQYPHLTVFYKMTKELAPDRAVMIYDNDQDKAIATDIISPNEKVTQVIQKQLDKLKKSAAQNNLKKK